MSDERVIEQLHRYGAWVEREAGLSVRSATGTSSTETAAREDSVVTAVEDTGPRHRWASARWPRLAFVALAAVASVVVAVVMLRPDGDPAALYTRAGDPDGHLFVLPSGDGGYEVSGGIVNSTSPGALPTAERVWIGSPDESGTSFRDVIQVCVSRVAAECSAMPTPDSTRGRMEVDGRFFPVTTSGDGSAVVVTDERDLWHVAVRGGRGSDPAALATLLTQVEVENDGVPSVDVGPPRVVFAQHGSIERIGTRRVHTTSFEVRAPSDDHWQAVSTATGTLVASSPVILPGLVELDEVSLSEEIIDDVTVTKLTFVLPELGTINTLSWQSSPNRLISVGGSQTSFAELTDIARSLVETSEAEWKAALPDHRDLRDPASVEAD